MPVLYLLMHRIRLHYERVRAETAPLDAVTLPASNHAVVLVSRLHQPTLQALAYAKGIRPASLEALTVQVDRTETAALERDWREHGIDVPLVVLDSPYREITCPVVDYVKAYRRGSPRDVVTVLIPEYVAGRWWQQLLHNQNALRIKSRLLFQPGVIVTSVPYQLRSGTARAHPTRHRRPRLAAAARRPPRRVPPHRRSKPSPRMIGHTLREEHPPR